MLTHHTGLLVFNVDKRKCGAPVRQKELLYTSFLTQDWVKPALIYLRNKKKKNILKKITKKRQKYTNLCHWRSPFTPVLSERLWIKATTRGRHNTYQYSWMSACFLSQFGVLMLHTDVFQHCIEIISWNLRWIFLFSVCFNAFCTFSLKDFPFWKDAFCFINGPMFEHWFFFFSKFDNPALVFFFFLLIYTPPSTGVLRVFPNDGALAQPALAFLW